MLEKLGTIPLFIRQRSPNVDTIAKRDPSSKDLLKATFLLLLLNTALAVGFEGCSKGTDGETIDQLLQTRTPLLVSPSFTQFAYIQTVTDERGFSREQLQLINRSVQTSTLYNANSNGSITDVFWIDEQRIAFTEISPLPSEIPDHGGLQYDSDRNQTETRIMNVTTGKVSDQP